MVRELRRRGLQLDLHVVVAHDTVGVGVIVHHRGHSENNGGKVEKTGATQWVRSAEDQSGLKWARNESG